MSDEEEMVGKKQRLKHLEKEIARLRQEITSIEHTDEIRVDNIIANIPKKDLSKLGTLYRSLYATNHTVKVEIDVGFEEGELCYNDFIDSQCPAMKAYQKKLQAIDHKITEEIKKLMIKYGIDENYDGYWDAIFDRLNKEFLK